MAPSSNPRYHARIAGAREWIARQRLDGLLVADLLNVRYLCGFTGSNGLLLVLEDRSVFFTDSRYTLQAREETWGVEVVPATDLDAAAVRLATHLGLGYVGLQAKSVTAARWQRLLRALGGIDLVDAGTAVDQQRACKDAEEIEALGAAARLAEQCLVSALPVIREGETEAAVARRFHHEALERGADALSFETIVAGGERGALPHAQPGNRAFREGDLVVVDFGVRLRGYCSDETVTVSVGSVGDAARAVYDLVYTAQQAALSVLRAGVRLAEVDRAAREIIGEAGHAAHFGHGTGHGVGLAVHEIPTVGPRSDEVARPGMVLTVEPGIYLGGRFGVRLEDTVRVTAEGFERITSAPKAFGAVREWSGPT